MTLRIALDWDGTVNADPDTFKKVALAFLDAGHDVSIVTWRAPGVHYEDMTKLFDQWGFALPVVFTGGSAKRDYYDADIWIDDNPASAIFSLTREPRFEADPAAYNQDPLVCVREGYETIHALWPQLRT